VGQAREPSAAEEYAMQWFVAVLMSISLSGLVLIQDVQPENGPADETEDSPSAEAQGDNAEDGSDAEEAGRKPFQDEILKQLLREQEAPKVIPRHDPSSPDDLAEQPDTPDRRLLMEGTFLTERPAELVTSQAGLRLMVRLPDGDRSVAIEPLENGNREALEREARRGASQFLISGEITRYRDQNFILLRKIVQRMDNGNLRP
jgi:hypothetical protein